MRARVPDPQCVCEALGRLTVTAAVNINAVDTGKNERQLGPT